MTFPPSHSIGPYSWPLSYPHPTPIFSTHFQLPPKIFWPTCGCQFTSQKLTHHQHSYQASNSSNPNPCDHHDSMPCIIPTPLTLTWTWVSSLDVLGSFHLNLCCLWLYNCIPITLRLDVQVAFHFSLDKLTHEPYNVIAWNLFFLVPQWCLILPLHDGVTSHKEMQIQFKWFPISN
jgi:hypothetical protein